MKRTVVCHFFNEEYLLPWWLEHHKKYFDHGVMINYGSWDRSVEIIREICPGWEIVDSRNEYFTAQLVDAEVQHYELQHDGWRVCLNVTEFLVGDYRLLDTVDYNLQVRQVLFVDEDRSVLPTHDRPLWEQKFHGFDFDIASTNAAEFNRHARLIHRDDPNGHQHSYPCGRHFEYYNTDQLAVFYYAWCPWNIRMKMRRMQTGAKVEPMGCIDWTVHQNYSITNQYPHNMYPPYALEGIYNVMQSVSKPQHDMIDYFTALMNDPKANPVLWKSNFDISRQKQRGRFFKHTAEPDNKHESIKQNERSNLLDSLFNEKPRPEPTIDGNNIVI